MRCAPVVPGAYVDSVQLAAGSIPFGHGAITQAAYDDFRARDAKLVAAVTTPIVPLDRRLTREPVCGG